jgi:hypothetical protein
MPSCFRGNVLQKEEMGSQQRTEREKERKIKRAFRTIGEDYAQNLTRSVCIYPWALFISNNDGCAVVSLIALVMLRIELFGKM